MAKSLGQAAAAAAVITAKMDNCDTWAGSTAAAATAAVVMAAKAAVFMVG